MSNLTLFNFIKTKLNVIANADESNSFLFGGEHLFTYEQGQLSLQVANAQTLQLDKHPIIPFTAIAFDGERVALAHTKIQQFAIPLVFGIRYGNKEVWEQYIEDFADSINGKTFDVGGVATAFGTTPISSNGVEIELDAEDWIQVTLTVFAYSGNVMMGNDIIFTLDTSTAGNLVVGVRYRIKTVGNTNFTLIGASDNNVGTIFTATGVGAGTGTVSKVIEPLNYAKSMVNEMNYTTPANLTYGVNKSNGKQHRRKIVILQDLLLADTWIKEIEGNAINTDYEFNVEYPFDTPYSALRTMKVDNGSVVVVNGTSVLIEMDFVD